MSLFGVDVSSYQPSGYDTSGLSFAFVKATESTNYVNPKYSAQLDTARSAGLVVGHYHFAHPGNAGAQARYFLDNVDLRPGEVIAYDWEASGVSQGDRDAWISAVKAALPGVKVLLYCNRDFWRNIDSENGGPADGLWIADPNAPAGRPNISFPWVIHQYSWSGGIDRNVANFGSIGDLRAWVGENAVPAQAPASDPNAFPGSQYFGPGQSNDYVARLGQLLIARGAGRFYSVGAGPSWSDADSAATKAFQEAQGWSGGDADGIPGPATWNLLVTGQGNSIPALPRVSLANVVDAARTDPGAAQGYQSHADDVRPVEAGLVAEGLLAAQYGYDGSFGSTSVAAYAEWQRRCGYSGDAANGIPGHDSLARLGERHGFEVTD
ncbi:peptidoglycan-binding protein [Kitasatospora cathayae]|uniref:Peptidoglycan-binding protein n=1 Tax=Kitasatospora cathayae TaxID=3004092 RepID=A0ABY7Q2Z7_9ACTN|nr:peptidoglycan-binding protein [Kitasatospora sp. HUAS 3-15]WBP87035.1 peptidoglycan-binding protein [Kitasatospora sp. HUAS 3-15]